MPDLNIPRSNPSGFVLGEDYLYVIGGEFQKGYHVPNCISIEKINLKQYMNLTKFELLDITLPLSL
jgi:hypothetical protein